VVALSSKLTSGPNDSAGAMAMLERGAAAGDADAYHILARVYGQGGAFGTHSATLAELETPSIRSSCAV
jgi:hypothetical protein